MRTITSIDIYWDDQDADNAGWAYQARYSDSHEEGGSLDTDPEHTLQAISDRLAVAKADLGLQGIKGDYVCSMTGEVTWTPNR